jgi:hypothetical protein
VEIGVFAASPDPGKELLFLRCLIGEQEQAVPALQPGTRFKKRLHPAGDGRNGENTEPLDAKVPLVNLVGPGRFVGKQFAAE